MKIEQGFGEVSIREPFLELGHIYFNRPNGSLYIYVGGNSLANLATGYLWNHGNGYAGAGIDFDDVTDEWILVRSSNDTPICSAKIQLNESIPAIGEPTVEELARLNGERVKQNLHSTGIFWNA